jgi:pimeloyl-ACP methyl ester carboxylesterase
MFKSFKALAFAGAMLSLASPAASQIPAGSSKGAYVDVPGGKLWYESCGAGGAGMVLIHDGVLHSVVWDQVWPILCKDFHVVRYDRRGYGRSPEAKAPYSPAEDLGAVMGAAGVSHAVLVGSSNGGGLAIDFTLAHPDQVDRLVLVGPSVSGIPYSAHFIERGQEIGQMIGRGQAMAAIKSSWLLAPGHDAEAKGVQRLLMANLQDITHRDPAIPRPPAAPRLGEIRVPTLILVGEADIADNQSQAGVVEYAIPHARRVVVRNAGHLVYFEQPEVFAGLVADFARDEQGRAASAGQHAP